MRNNKLFFLQVYGLAIILILFSCQKVIEIDYPTQETKLVVNCLFTPDSLFKARISKTSFTTDSSDLSIKDATCEIWSAGQLLETLQHTKNGFYISESLYPEVNKAYTIKVKHEIFPDLTATDTVPEPANVLDINFDFFTQYDMLDERYFHDLNITLNDNPNKSNFYQIKGVVETWHVNYEINTDTIWVYNNIYLNTDDFAFQNSEFTESAIIPFTDSFFNGQNYTVKLKYKYPFASYSNGVPYIETHNLLVPIYSTSKQYYKYRTKLIQHINNQYSDVYFGIGDPVQMYTNIQGGYGIFAAYNSELYILHHENE